MSELTVIHLTDTHIRAAGEHVLGIVDTRANLIQVLDRLRVAGQRIHAIVLSGDLTDNGAPAAYRRLREIVEPAAAELRARVVYVMGNHDERTAFGEELLGRAPGTVDPTQPHHSVTEVEGLRIIALDTTIPGRHDGRLEPDQLHWLAAQLRRPAPMGTLLALHHPPMPSPLAAAEALKLEGAQRLADVIAGTDVRMIVSGHYHLTGAAALAGIPVWIGPALAYRIDTLPPAGRLRAVTGFGYSRIDVLGSTFVATAVEATTTRQIYDRDEAAELDRLAPYTGAR